jgi:pimeloyl-ACP methyl ester carboxylesterase
MTSTRDHVAADDGTRLFVQRAGERDGGERPLLVLNGFYLFDDFAWLAGSRAVIGLDLRNRGRSEWVRDPSKLARGVQQDIDDIEAVRRHLGLDELDLLAHSYAGLVAILYAVRHPSRVGRIVQIGPMPPDSGAEYPEELKNHDDVLREFYQAAGALQQQRGALSPREMCQETWTLLRRLYVYDPANAGRLRHWEACDLDTELDFSRYWSEALLPSIQRLELGEADVAPMTMPVLVVHGREDRSAPYGGGRDWARLLPNARLLTVERAAHAPWIEAEEEVFGAVRVFLAGEWPERAVRPADSDADRDDPG